MTELLESRIAELDDGEILEAAVQYLSHRFAVTSDEEARERVSEALRGIGEEPGPLIERAEGVATDPQGVLGIARLVLMAEAVNTKADRAKLRETVESAGGKQFISEGTVLALAGLLVVGYLVRYTIDKTSGTTSKEGTIFIKRKPDGSIVVRLHAKEVRIDPFSKLGEILSSIFNLGGPSSGSEGNS